MFTKRSQSQFESSRHNLGGGALLTKLTSVQCFPTGFLPPPGMITLNYCSDAFWLAEENVLVRTIDLHGGQMTPHQVDIVLLRFSQQLSSW